MWRDHVFCLVRSTTENPFGLVMSWECHACGLDCLPSSLKYCLCGTKQLTEVKDFHETVPLLRDIWMLIVAYWTSRTCKACKIVMDDESLDIGSRIKGDPEVCSVCVMVEAHTVLCYPNSSSLYRTIVSLNSGTLTADLQLQRLIFCSCGAVHFPFTIPSCFLIFSSQDPVYPVLVKIMGSRHYIMTLIFEYLQLFGSTTWRNMYMYFTVG